MIEQLVRLFKALQKSWGWRRKGSQTGEIGRRKEVYSAIKQLIILCIQDSEMGHVTHLAGHLYNTNSIV